MSERELVGWIVAISGTIHIWDAWTEDGADIEDVPDGTFAVYRERGPSGDRIVVELGSHDQASTQSDRPYLVGRRPEQTYEPLPSPEIRVGERLKVL